MNPRIIVALITFSPVLSGAEKQDLLRFENGDQLHGSYEGITEGPALIWERDDVGDGVKFKTADVRQIVLRGGQPARSLANLSHVGTTNGDRVPGLVRGLDDERVLLETEFGGTLEIPRERVGLIAPNPLGGRILYHGPFDSEAWTMVTTLHPDGLPEVQAGKDDVEDNDDAQDEDGAEDKENAEDIPVWKFSGSAWYWQNDKSGTALARKSGLPDRAILKFDIAWKNRLSLAIGFHSNFQQPVEDEEDGKEGAKEQVRRAGQTTSLPEIFGDSYVLHLYSSYVMLYRTGFDDEGKPSLDRVQTTNSNVRLGDSGNASVEIRCNREAGEIILFVNGEFVVQWSESVKGLDDEPAYAGTGEGFGFLVQSNDCPVRISEVVVAEWNGMPDAARSLQVDDADIVLLANGTDRFSGKVTRIGEGKLNLEGRYGDFEFPMEEIAEIRFAKSKLRKQEELSSDSLKIRFHPLGRISGQPLSGDSERIQLLTEAAGEISINLESAIMLEFQETESYLDDWDVDF